MIRALVFDCFGVVVSSIRIFNEFPSHIASKVEEEITEVNETADLGKIDAVERTKRVAAILDREGLNGAEEIRSSYQNSKPRADLLEFIKVKRSDFKMGLLTNTPADIDWVFPAAERANFFDVEILSYQVGLTKPSLEIFKLAAQRLGVEPHECVFVDDSVNNIIGAEKVGMRGIVYQDFDQFRTDLTKILEQENA